MEEEVKQVKEDALKADYSDMRIFLHTGDLLAWSTDRTTFWSRMLTTFVRFFTLSEFAHVGIAYRDDNGRVYVLEATIPTIQMRLLSEVKGFYHVPMQIQWNDDLDVYLKHYTGKPYSLMDCIRGYLGHTDPSDDKWQCAELCNDFYKHAGIDLGDNYTPSKVVMEAISVKHTGITFIK